MKRVCFLKPLIKNPRIQVGDYTYYDSYYEGQDAAAEFEKNVLYHYDYYGDKLIIGKFCQISLGATFIMNGSGHFMGGASTYPFGMMKNGWESAVPESLPYKGDTEIGSDVWIGFKAVIMPGIKIGDGAIVGARSLVTRDVPPYTIVGGNPARVIRNRFDYQTIDYLRKLRWWDWPVEKITEHAELLHCGDIQKLKDIFPLSDQI